MALTFVVRAYNRHESEFKVSTVALSNPTTTQGRSPSRAGNKTHLASRVEIDRFRRLLGDRFVFSGKDSAVLNGTLVVGGQTHAVRITRDQGDDDGASRGLNTGAIGGVDETLVVLTQLFADNNIGISIYSDLDDDGVNIEVMQMGPDSMQRQAIEAWR